MAKNKKGGLPTTKAGETAKNSQENNNTPDEQNQSTSLADRRNRLLPCLRSRQRLTIIESRTDLDIMHPAGRILELLQSVHKIDTVWTNDTTREGKIHRVASYILNNKEVSHG